MRIKAILFISIAIIFTACGGGGGGGSGPTPSAPIIIPPSGPGITYTDPSQFSQTTAIPSYLQQVNAQTAYNNGFTGGNLNLHQTYQTVASDTSNRNLQTISAILDSGINPNHEEVSNAGKIAGFKDFTAVNSLTPYDSNGHGSFVAAVIAAQRQSINDDKYGISYDANLLIGQIVTAGTTDNITLRIGIDWVVQQKGILDVVDQTRLTALNISLGSTSSAFVTNSFKNSMVAAVNSGLSVVITAGNESLDCLDSGTGLNGKCSFPAAAPWLNPANTTDYLTANGGWIVVGSVDSNNVLSTFSNKAGVTKTNYLVAPGENIIGMSSTVNNGYMMGSGTSYSTPIVTGSLNLMAQKWPHLNGRQHSQILFDTATDLGAPGIDDIYGNGLLNLTDAFNPVGSIVIPASISVFNNNGQSVSGTSLVTSSALASLQSFEPLNNTIGLDVYNRDFTLNMTSTISSTYRSPIDFNNFLSFETENYIFGIDQFRNLPLFGIKLNDKTKLKVSYDNTFLGVESSGAFKIGSAKTIYTNIEKELINNKSFKVSLNGTYGYSTSKTEDNSLITNISDVHAFGGELTAQYKNIGIGYEIPLRAIKGSLNFKTPTDVDTNGNIVYSEYTANLVPETFEQKYSLFFEKELNNFYFLTKLSQTKDAFGIKNIRNNEAKVTLNYLF